MKITTINPNRISANLRNRHPNAKTVEWTNDGGSYDGVQLADGTLIVETTYRASDTETAKMESVISADKTAREASIKASELKDAAIALIIDQQSTQVEAKRIELQSIKQLADFLT